MRKIFSIILLSLLLFSCHPEGNEPNIFDPSVEVIPIVNYINCLEAWKGSPSEQYVKGKRRKGATQTHVNYGSLFFLSDLGDAIGQLFNDDCDEDEFDETIGIL